MERMQLNKCCINNLHRITGLSAGQLKNGGIQEIGIAIAVWRITKKEFGIKSNQLEIKDEVIQMVKETLRNSRVEELESQHDAERKQWRDELRRQENELEKAMQEKFESRISKLSEQIDGLNKSMNERDRLIQDKDRLLERLNTELDKVPIRKGSKLESDIASLLKHHFECDEIRRSTKGRNEIDITQTVLENKQPLGKILVECKDTRSFNNDWIRTAKEHMRRENTRFCIISTRAMPNEERLSPLGLYKDGIFITEPENTVWAVAFHRLAIVKTAEARRVLDAEKAVMQSSLKSTKTLMEKLDQIFKSADFGSVFSLCIDITRDGDTIKRSISGAHEIITSRVANIKHLVEQLTESNGNLAKKFENLRK